MQEQITAFVQACPSCQKNKQKHKKYRHLGQKVVEAQVWDKLCIDLIGPYNNSCKGKADLVCKCVTMIDPASSCLKYTNMTTKEQSQ